MNRTVMQERFGSLLRIERCQCEIAAIEAEIRAGNPDIEGLCLALSDWSAELRLLQQTNKSRPGRTQAAYGDCFETGQPFTE